MSFKISHQLSAYEMFRIPYNLNFTLSVSLRQMLDRVMVQKQEKRNGTMRQQRKEERRENRADLLYCTRHEEMHLKSAISIPPHWTESTVCIQPFSSSFLYQSHFDHHASLAEDFNCFPKQYHLDVLTL